MYVDPYERNTGTIRATASLKLYSYVWMAFTETVWQCMHFEGTWGVLRFGLDRDVLLEPQNPYPSLRVILVEKGTHC